MDVGDKASIESAIKVVEEQDGKLNVLVNK